MLGHGLSRMLSVNDPTDEIASSNDHGFNLPPIKALTKRFDSGILLALADQTQVPLVRKGREVSEVYCALLWLVRVIPPQLSFRIECVRNTTPSVDIVVVIRVEHRGSFPCQRIGRLARVGYDIFDLLNASSCIVIDRGAKAKVLEVLDIFQFREDVGFDLQRNVQYAWLLGAGRSG